MNDTDPCMSTNMLCANEQRYSQTLPNTYSKDKHKVLSYPRNEIHAMKNHKLVEIKTQNSYIQHELRLLLTRKQELESRVHQLRQSREELSSQLDNLSRILRSSPDLQQRSNLCSRSCVSPSRINYHTSHSKNNSFHSYSTPSTPIHHRLTNHCMINYFSL